MLEGEADIAIDVDLLLAVNVLGAHLSPRHGALPGELQSLFKGHRKEKLNQVTRNTNKLRRWAQCVR